ncbi:MAG TPA: glycosyltransferase family 2 protein [Candidatus Binatia bacterium]|nr:glycosyltransferase family 2 protein [Candidatus Binatia bacterium]
MALLINNWLDLILWGIALLFAWSAGAHLYHLRWARRLPSLRDQNVRPEGPAMPRVSVVIAARDEEARIENTVRHVLAQQGVEVEVIVADDRSNDRTAEILQRLAREDQRVKPIHIRVLPENWLGKCHACHTAAATATGEWILFTDADCWLKNDVLLRALLVARREGVEHITLTPGLATQNIGARAWHIGFLLTLSNWFSGVNRDRPKAYLGMGAFNLVRTDVYRAFGGYEALRLTVIDDVRFGLLVRRAGKRTRGYIGDDDTECHWGETVSSMIKVLEKNYFAAIDYNTAAVVVLVLGGSFVWLSALVGPFTGSIAGIAACLGLLSFILPALVVTKRLDWPRAIALLVPLIFPVLFYAMLNSATITLRQRGIRWRDTFYPLKVLKGGTVR